MRAGLRRAHLRAAPAGRRRRAGDAVELPRRDGHPQDRAGARRRLPGGAQAGLGDAADHAGADRRLLAEAGVPDGVVNVLPSRKSGAVVSAMLHDPRVRKLSFTGSTEVGRKLLHEAADTVRQAVDGARRQRAVHRLRGRRHRRRRRGRDDRQDAQHRRGLHRRQPLLRARAGARRVRRGARRQDGAPEDGQRPR